MQLLLKSHWRKILIAAFGVSLVGGFFAYKIHQRGNVEKRTRHAKRMLQKPSCYNKMQGPKFDSFPFAGRTYKTVAIGRQVWMAENLNYKIGNSWCYDLKAANCKKYGRLYDWKTALHACPKGWHLPSDREWDTLEIFLNGGASALLRSKEWGGLDKFGFSVYPSGVRFDVYPNGKPHHLGRFFGIGEFAVYWGSTQKVKTHEVSVHTFWPGKQDIADDFAPPINGTVGRSVRCIEDSLK